MGQIIMVAYKPKADKAEALKLLMKTHLPVLKEAGFVTDRPSIMMETADGIIIEVFEWLSAEAIQQAHTHPKVLEMWAAYSQVCDYVPISSVPEASSLFSSFTPLN